MRVGVDFFYKFIDKIYIFSYIDVVFKVDSKYTSELKSP